MVLCRRYFSALTKSNSNEVLKTSHFVYFLQQRGMCPSCCSCQFRYKCSALAVEGGCRCATKRQKVRARATRPRRHPTLRSCAGLFFGRLCTPHRSEACLTSSAYSSRMGQTRIFATSEAASHGIWHVFANRHARPATEILRYFWPRKLVSYLQWLL